MCAQCCQFMPQPAIFCLVTSTRICPSENAPTFSSLAVVAVFAADLHGIGISFSNRSPSSFRSRRPRQACRYLPPVKQPFRSALAVFGGAPRAAPVGRRQAVQTACRPQVFCFNHVLDFSQRRQHKTRIVKARSDGLRTARAHEQTHCQNGPSAWPFRRHLMTSPRMRPDALLFKSFLKNDSACPCSQDSQALRWSCRVR